MPTLSVASPLCTWLVAACMSVAGEKDHPLKSPSLLFQSPKRLRRRKVLTLTQCSNNNTGSGIVDDRGSLQGGLISSLCGSSGIHNLMSSCLAFEPCDQYYSSNGLSTLAFCGDNGFSLFGSKRLPVTRRQRRMNRAVHSGKIMAVAVQPAKEAAMKKKPLTKRRRVVVTGLSVVTPLGLDADVFYDNLLEGISGISEIEAFDCAQFPMRIAGEIKSFSADEWVAPKLSKRADKFMLFLLTAGKKALADGGITKDVMRELDKAKCGVLIGSALGGMKVFNDAIEALRVSYKMNPFCVPFATANMGSAMLAMDLGWMGPNYSISAACATRNVCILNAANHIVRGETDMMLCGGSDAAVIPIGLGGFVACGALSQRNADPTKASRPWDINRDGFVIGEGAGVLLLEELEHAKKRSANVYAEFLGGSFTADAYHMIEPHRDGMGIVLCIEKALAQSGVAREDVNYVNAHATSTPTSDLKEYLAIIQCFGQNPVLRVNSTKCMTGYLLGAAGAVEAVATIKDLTSKKIFGKGFEHDGLYYFGELLSSSPLPPTSSLQAFVLLESLSCHFTSQALDLWNAHLGHVNFQYLCLLFPTSNKACKNNKFYCVVCELSKHTRNSYIPRMSHASSMFDLIHYDIWGSSSVTAFSRYWYYLTFIDDHSWCTWVYLLKKKI